MPTIDQDDLTKDDVLKIVREKGFELRYLEKHWRMDPDVVLTAVLQDGMALQWAHPVLQTNTEICAAALYQNKGALKFVPDSIKEEALQLSTMIVDLNKKEDNKSLKNLVDPKSWEQYSAELKYWAVHTGTESILITDGNTQKIFETLEIRTGPTQGFNLGFIFEIRDAIINALANQIQDQKNIPNLKCLNNTTIDKEGRWVALPDSMTHKEYTTLVAFVKTYDLSHQQNLLKNNSVIEAISFKNLAALPPVRTIDKNSTREEVLEAVKRDGLLLEKANEDFKKDPEITLTAVTQNKNSLTFVEPIYKLQNPLLSKIAGLENEHKQYAYMFEGNRDTQQHRILSLGEDGEYMTIAAYNTPEEVMEFLRGQNQPGIDNIEQFFQTTQFATTTAANKKMRIASKPVAEQVAATEENGIYRQTHY